MLKAAIANLCSGDLNAIGLVLGFVGAILLVLFGLPPIGVLNEGSYVEIQVTPMMKYYIWISRAGLALLAIGFVLQFLSTAGSLQGKGEERLPLAAASLPEAKPNLPPRPAEEEKPANNALQSDCLQRSRASGNR